MTLTKPVEAEDRIDQSANCHLLSAPINNIIPPSPEASALAKYADIPVNLYSGTPDITIPLFDLQERDLNLPISLRYHASGHKVEDEAPRTGLGWSLNAGGVISRSMRGLPDEYGSSAQGISAPKGFLAQAAEMDSAGKYGPGHNEYTDEQRDQWYYAMAEGCRDAEPDVFYFNFAGYSGKFQFDWDGEIVIESGSKLSITPIGLNPINASFIQGWEVKTPDGLRFVFNVQETTTPRYLAGDLLSNPCPIVVASKSPPQSWYLAEISSIRAAVSLTSNSLVPVKRASTSSRGWASFNCSLVLVQMV